MARQVKYNGMTIAVPDDASDDEVSTILETKERETRGLLEAQLAERQAASATADRNNRIANLVEGPVRATAQALTGLARGNPLVALPAAIEEGVEGVARLFGAENGIPRVLRGPADALSPPELAPRNDAEQFVQTGSDFVGGFVGGMGTGTGLARSASPTARVIGEGLTDAPAAQLVSAGTGAAGLEAAREAGAGPVGQTIASIVAGGAPLVAGTHRTAPNRAPAAVIPEGAEAGVPGVRPQLGTPENPRPFSESVRAAREAGYPLLPSQVGAKAQTLVGEGQLPPSVPGSFRETFASPALRNQFAIDSQKVTNRLAAQELGLTELTPMGLQFAKNPHNAVFNEVAQSLPVLRADWELGNAAMELGAARRNNPLLRTTTAVEEVRDRLLSMESVPTQQALDAIRSYRQDASKLFKQAEMGGSGIGVLEAEQAALAYRGAADALEAAIERQAGMLYPDLVPRLRDARTQLAKIHNVEDAFDGTNVDPQAVLRMSKLYPLSGYLQTIADAAKNFGDTNFLTTGTRLPTQSNQSVFTTVNLAARRLLGRETQNPMLLSPEFQNRYGRANPNFDPRTPPPEVGGSPFAEFTPPDPNLPGGADVMPPGPVLGPEVGRMGAVGLADEFDTLPEADMRPGDLTAETPPMGGSLPGGLVDDLLNAPDLGLEQPPRRFTAGPDNTLDEGLTFVPDPDMAGAPIVRGGGEPGPVVDSPALDQALLDAELRGRPLDPTTGAGIAPEGVDQPFTRPSSDLGDQFGMGLDELDGGPPRLGAPGEPRGPTIIEGEFEDITGQRALPPPQKRLPPPEDDLGAAFVEPEPPPQGGGGGGLVDELTSEAPAPTEAPPRLPAPEAPQRGSRRGSEQWRNEGKSDADLMAERVANEADGVAQLLAEGTIEKGQLREAIRTWAEDAGIPEDELRYAVRQRVPDAPLRPVDLGDELTLADDLPEPDDIRARYRGERDIPPGAIIVESPTKKGYIAARPMDDGSWQIRSAFVKEGSRGQGIGQDNLVQLAKKAEAEGVPLHSDKKLSRDQVERVYSRLRDKGVIEFDGDLDAVLRAMDETDNATNPTGEPWLKNIRLGPAG